MSMTIDEFFEKLAETREEMEWQYWNVMSTDNNERIRGKKGIEEHFCPITAVCYKLTGVYYRCFLWHLAAQQIELPGSIASNIADAADSAMDHDEELRTKLIETLQL